jgi:hypothetical protein
MKALGMHLLQPLHEPRQIVVAPRPQHKMKVVAEQVVRKNSHAEFFARGVHQRDEVGVVVVTL